MEKNVERKDTYTRLGDAIVIELNNNTTVVNNQTTVHGDVAKAIEDLVSCNLQNLEKGGTLSISNGGGLLAKLEIKDGMCKLSDESIALVTITSIRGEVRSRCYYGSEADVVFEPKNREFSSGVKTLEAMLNAWEAKKGRILREIIIVDDENLYNEMLSNGGVFGSCIILLTY